MHLRVYALFIILLKFFAHRSGMSHAFLTVLWHLLLFMRIFCQLVLPGLKSTKLYPNSKLHKVLCYLFYSSIFIKALSIHSQHLSLLVTFKYVEFRLHLIRGMSIGLIVIPPINIPLLWCRQLPEEKKEWRYSSFAATPTVAIAGEIKLHIVLQNAHCRLVIADF